MVLSNFPKGLHSFFITALRQAASKFGLAYAHPCLFDSAFSHSLCLYGSDFVNTITLPFPLIREGLAASCPCIMFSPCLRGNLLVLASATTIIISWGAKCDVGRVALPIPICGCSSVGNPSFSAHKALRWCMVVRKPFRNWNIWACVRFFAKTSPLHTQEYIAHRVSITCYLPNVVHGIEGHSPCDGFEDLEHQRFGDGRKLNWMS